MRMGHSQVRPFETLGKLDAEDDSTSLIQRHHRNIFPLKIARNSYSIHLKLNLCLQLSMFEEKMHEIVRTKHRRGTEAANGKSTSSYWVP